MYKKLKRKIAEIKNAYKVRGKQKVFCIGRNKTGTTSTQRAFLDLGYIAGIQRTAEELLRHYQRSDFDAIIKYCKTGEVFQDIPFSYPETYKHLDKAYPNSKFILTVRSSSEVWYNSLTKFHAKKFGHGNIPTKEDLQAAQYIWKGYVWEANRILYKTPEDDIYNKEILIKHYEKHNQEIINYFKDRPNDLLVLDLSIEGAYQSFCEFIGVKSDKKDFPWENKTKLIKA